MWDLLPSQESVTQVQTASTTSTKRSMFSGKKKAPSKAVAHFADGLVLHDTSTGMR